MRSETIFYYVTEESMTGRPEYRKKHFWQKIRPVSFVVEKEEMTVVTFLIPGLQKGWKREKLFQLMQESAEEHPLRAGGVRILIQPQVRYLLAEPEEKNRDTSSKSEIYRQQAWTETFLAVCFPLSERILRERFQLQGRKAGMIGPESVVILMGTLFFPEEQMQHLAEMIAPYLPCINALTIFYEAGDAGENCGGSRKTADAGIETEAGTEPGGNTGIRAEAETGRKIGTRAEAETTGTAGFGTEVEAIGTAGFGTETEQTVESGTGYLEQAIHAYAEELYYEYGLVSQIIRSPEAPSVRFIRPVGQIPVLFLDYGYAGAMPYRMLKEGGIYLDVASSEKKEALFRRKYRGIFYQSPRKYLDTVVKSGYDK